MPGKEVYTKRNTSPGKKEGPKKDKLADMESNNPQVGKEGLTAAPGYPPQEQGNSEEGAPPPVIDVPQYTGEMPDEDLDDNPEAVPPEITPPSLDKMDTIEGYQNIGFSGDFLPPPPYAEVTQVPEDRKNVTDVAVLKEDEARQALRLYVGEHFCFGKGPVEELTFTELQTSSAFHYTLDSFTEARSTEWAYKPYKGGHIDGPENGPAPGPWDIPAQCEELFKDEKKKIEVPHTASVKPCHNCFATGFIRCWRCEGRGRNRCISCQGSGKGMQEEENCFHCSGEGTKSCVSCHGKGMVKCEVCKSHRNIKCYIELKIKWHKHDDNHIVERTSLPDKLIKKAEGRIVFEETYPKVYPIQHFEEQEINGASSNLLTKHQYPMERILMQRQRVKVVPVTVCRYRWKDDESDFIVYGFEKKVYAPNYPQQICCGCSVL